MYMHRSVLFTRRLLVMLAFLLVVQPLLVPFPAAKAEMGSIYDTLEPYVQNVLPASKGFEPAPSGTYYASPFTMGKVSGQALGISFFGQYVKVGSATETAGAVAIYTDNNGRPGVPVSAQATASGTLTDFTGTQVDNMGSYTWFFDPINYAATIELQQQRQYWVVYGGVDADAGNIGYVAVEPTPGAVTDWAAGNAPHAEVTGGNKVYKLTGAGTGIASLDWSGASLTQGRLVPFKVIGSVAYPINDLEATPSDTQVYLRFTNPSGATAVVVEQSADGLNWSTAQTKPLDENSHHAVVSGLSNGKTYQFRLKVTGGSWPGLSNVVTATPIDYKWQVVGEYGFSPSEIAYPALAVDGNGVVYTAFSSTAGNGDFTVLKFNGASWEPVGSPGIAGGFAEYAAMAVDSDHVPYVAYRTGPQNKLTVKRFDGSQWQIVGTAAFTGNAALDVQLRIDSAKRVIVAYEDSPNNDGTGKVSVMRYTPGGAWEALGSGISAGDDIRSLSLALDAGGNPYVAYADRGLVSQIYSVNVRKYDGTAWSDVGPGNLTGELKSTFMVAVAVEPLSGVPYIVYNDPDSQTLEARMFSGGQWADSGRVSQFRASEGQRLKLEFNARGMLYAAFSESRSEQSQPLVVKRLSSGVWKTLGYEQISTMTAKAISFAIDDRGYPYTAYADVLNDTYGTVKYFVPPVLDLTASGGQKNARLTFQAPAGATSVAVEQSLDGIHWTTATAEVVTGSSTGTMVTGLLPRTTYYFRLIVTGGDYDGITNTASATTLPLPDSSAPSVVSASPTTITWNKGTEGSIPIKKVVGAQLPMSAALLGADGNPLSNGSLSIDGSGKFTLPSGLTAGEYTMKLYIVSPNGEKLAGGTAKLKVDSQGSADVQAELIDPYGTITDRLTGKPIDGVKTTLYWADTELNRSKGRVAHTAVPLPELPDFAPNQNLNPQISRNGGLYGWMVYPDGDYYILAIKEGYIAYDSRQDKREAAFGDDSYIKNGIIHVGVSIVEHSFMMDPAKVSEQRHEPYMRGYEDGLFKPGNSLTRAELAAILSRVVPAAATAEKMQIAYNDVQPSHWARADIDKVTEEGWLQGYPGGGFNPERAVTRAELAQALANVRQWKGSGDATSGFADVPASHWASTAIAAAEREGLISGYSDGAFRPEQPITRAEAVKIVNRMSGRAHEGVPGTSAWPDVAADYWAYADIMEASILHTFDTYSNGIQVWAK